MNLLLDVVDLMQLQEVWSWRPIVVAFSRLERREALPGSIRFDLNALIPRLAQLRRSPDWLNAANDPARLPIRDFSETDLSRLCPDTSADTVRQSLFDAAYDRFVVARYRGSAGPTCRLLLALAEARRLDAADYLDDLHLPRPGSPDWIPADITDEIRSLDGRYDAAEPGTPAAYVIADSFWTLLVKAETADLEAAARCQDETPAADARRQLAELVEVARAWNRSPSVVGLCYQIVSETENRD
ncbi:MAG: hypothetical protein HXY41_14270 [Chloroflexi bacterium]|nr:hypothetical protein [Chloroflexota bacterium]